MLYTITVKRIHIFSGRLKVQYEIVTRDVSKALQSYKSLIAKNCLEGSDYVVFKKNNIIVNKGYICITCLKGRTSTRSSRCDACYNKLIEVMRKITASNNANSKKSKDKIKGKLKGVEPIYSQTMRVGPKIIFSNEARVPDPPF